MASTAQSIQSGSSSPITLLGTGRIPCVICGIRPHYNDGKRSFPTCGNTCARKLKELTDVKGTSYFPEAQLKTSDKCIICKTRPQFNNGRKAFPTCGNTCAKLLQDMSNPKTDHEVDFQINTTGRLSMCYVCNLRPRHRRGWKVYPACGLTCAARLHSLDRHLTSQVGQNRNFDGGKPSLKSSSKGKAREVVDLSESIPEDGKAFECTICLESLPIGSVSRFSCRHPFCRPCLKAHILSEIHEHHYPIICPLCKIEDKATEPSTVDDHMLQALRLNEEDMLLFNELQLAAHSVAIHCKKCKETMFVDRKDYKDNDIIECPLPRCNYIWCKHCHMELTPNRGPRHSCDGSRELEHLMKEQGWKHCPGCQTPVQKSDGCNHMTCTAPGCNVHFCYKCGVNIIRSLKATDIRGAVKEHYQLCQLF